MRRSDKCERSIVIPAQAGSGNLPIPADSCVVIPAKAGIQVLHHRGHGGHGEREAEGVADS